MKQGRSQPSSVPPWHVATFVLPGLAAIACGRGPAPTREPVPTDAQTVEARDAGPRDADTSDRDLADATAPDATDAAVFSTADEDALGDALARLSDEHREGWGPAVAWLVAHPQLSRRALADIVDAGGSPANLAVDRAALALGEIGAVEDVATLARALARGGETMASKFALALARHQSDEAVAALTTATASPDIDVVRAAAMALGTRGGATARAPSRRCSTTRTTASGTPRSSR